MLGSHDLVALIPTSDGNRAKPFYQDTLGLKFVGQDDFALIFDANGIVLRVSFVPGHTPSQHAVLGWKVPDIVSTVKQLTQAGVKFEKYPFLEQDELGIWDSPNGKAKVAFFKDPDGNVLSISQM